MATKKGSVISIPALQLEVFEIRIVGDSPLISHAWDQKAQIEMYNKQQQKKKAKIAPEERHEPYLEFANSLYWLTKKPDIEFFDNIDKEEKEKLRYEVLSEVIPKSKFGFPTTAFKAAAVNAAYRQNLEKNRTTLRGALRVLGEFAEIEGTPTMRVDMVRIGRGAPDFRYRGEFKSWKTTLQVQYNTSAFSAEQIVNYFNLGGYANGVGDWRPEKGGNFGSYHVE